MRNFMLYPRVRKPGRVFLVSLIALQVAFFPLLSRAVPSDGSIIQNERGVVASTGPSAQPVGVGSFAGEATYSIPIVVPDNAGGVQPNLALRYSSHAAAQSSWVGAGWSLELGNISRSLKRGVPTYDNALDTFVLNNEEMVNDAPPLSGAWHTERESFVDIRTLPADISPPGTALLGWEVRTQDGTVSRYGYKQGSLNEGCVVRNPNQNNRIYSWLLCEVEDVHGNTMRVAYDRTDPGTAYPSVIEYGSGGSAAQSGPDLPYIMNFDLEARDDHTESYAAGFAQEVNYRLDAVRIRVLKPGTSSTWENLAKYELEYGDPSPDSFRSLLREVVEVGTNWVLPLEFAGRRHKFTYRSNHDEYGFPINQGWTLATPQEFDWTVAMSLVGSDHTEQGVRLADMNGDGLPDLVKAFTEVTWTLFPDLTYYPDHVLTADSGVYLNTGTGFSATKDPSFSANWPTATVVLGPNQWEVPLFIAFACVPNGLPSDPCLSSPPGLIVANGTAPTDLTGDGRADFMGVSGFPPNNNVSDTPMWQAPFGPTCSSTGDDFICPSPWLDGTFFTTRFAPIWTDPNNILGFPVPSPLGVGVFGGNSRYGDLNGDGLLDVIVRGDELQRAGTSCNLYGLRSYVAINQGGLQFQQHSPTTITVPQDQCPAPPIGTIDQKVSADYQPCDLATDPDCWKRSLFTAMDLGVNVATEWLVLANLELGNAVVDLNGDGLADSVASTEDLIGSTVHKWTGLNDGNGGYAEKPGWQTGTWWELPQYLSRWESEVPLQWYGTTRGKTSDTGVRLADVNGDHRVDVLRAKDGVRQAWLNDGDAGKDSGGAPFDGDDGTPWDFRTAWKAPNGIDFVNAQGQDNGVRLLDVNGDGMTDIVASKGGTNDVYLNDAVVPDLLETVTNPFGGTTMLAYTASTQFDHTGTDTIPDLPSVMHLVTKVTTDNQQGSIGVNELAYDDGVFDAGEREFRGFREVKSTLREGAAGPVHREVTTTYYQDDARVGLPESTLIRDGQGNLWSIRTTSYTPDIDGAPYVSLPEYLDFFEYNGTATPRHTRTKLEYGGFGLLIHKIEYGEFQSPGVGDIDPTDSRWTQWSYGPNNPADYIVGLVAMERVRAGASPGSGAILRESHFFYDNDQSATPGTVAPTLGNLTKHVAIGDAGGPNPTTTFGHDAYGSVTTVTNARANEGEIPLAQGTTTVEYDALFHSLVTTVTNGLGHRTEFEYTDDNAGTFCSASPFVDDEYPAGGGHVHIVRRPNDAGGTSSKHCPDDYGRNVQETASGDLAYTATTYNDLVSLNTEVSTVTVRQTDAVPNYHSHTRGFDGFGRVYHATADGPQGETVTTTSRTFDALGRVSTELAPYFDTVTAPPPTTYAYDPLGRATSVDFPGTGRIHTLTYEHIPVGNETHVLAKYTDANNAIVKHKHDPFGNLVEVQEHGVLPAGLPGGPYVTVYDYDELGQLRNVIDHHMNQTTIDYNLLGRRQSLLDPDTGLTTYEYDADGNLTKQIAPLGTVQVAYDGLDRPTRSEHEVTPGVFSTDTTWRWDSSPNGIGLLSQRNDVLSGVDYRVTNYDVLGRPLREVYRSGAAWHEFNSTYDFLGNLATRTYPRTDSGGGTTLTPRTIEWKRDDDGYLTSVESESVAYAGQIDWDAPGRLVGWTAGNSVRWERSYDATTDRLATLKLWDDLASLAKDLTYGFDDGDRLTSITDQLDASRNADFIYDALHRVVQADGPYGVNQTPITHYFDYDPIGNMTCRARLSTNPSNCDGYALTYPTPQALPGVARPHGAITAGGITVGYDTSGAGYIASLGSRAYAYDERGNLTSASEGGGELRSFKYDAAGRVHRIEAPGGVVERHLVTPGFEWDAVNDRAQIHLRLGGARIGSLEERYNPPQLTECEDGIDNDFDGLIDWPADPGCASTNDTSERGSSVCDDGIDNDGDGRVDYDPVTAANPGNENTPPAGLGDPGCADPSGTKEAPKCNNGIDDDGQTGIDYDGGAWLNGGVPLDVPDPQCVGMPMRDAEGEGGCASSPTSILPFTGPGGAPLFGLAALLVLLFTVPRHRMAHAFFATAVALAWSVPALADDPLGVTYYHRDHLRSSIVVSDDNGTLTHATYQTYGQLVDAPGQSQVPEFGYTSHRFVESLDIYNFGSRWYDPALGRFLQPDSLVPFPSNPQAFNRYAYVLNNAINLLDPTGGVPEEDETGERESPGGRENPGPGPINDFVRPPTIPRGGLVLPGEFLARDLGLRPPLQQDSIIKEPFALIHVSAAGSPGVGEKGIDGFTHLEAGVHITLDPFFRPQAVIAEANATRVFGDTLVDVGVVGVSPIDRITDLLLGPIKKLLSLGSTERRKTIRAVDIGAGRRDPFDRNAPVVVDPGPGERLKPRPEEVHEDPYFGPPGSSSGTGRCPTC